jgi:hypothetical protein
MAEPAETTSQQATASLGPVWAYGEAGVRTVFAFTGAGVKSISAFVLAGAQSLEAFRDAHHASRRRPPSPTTTGAPIDN